MGKLNDALAAWRAVDKKAREWALDDAYEQAFSQARLHDLNMVDAKRLRPEYAVDAEARARVHASQRAALLAALALLEAAAEEGES